jgi:signal transduction histidine kinase
VEFGIAAAIVFGAGMLGGTAWLNRQIRQGIAEQTSITTALFMESFVQSSVQELVTAGPMPDEAKSKLAHILTDTPLGKHVASIKIWGLDGTILFSTTPELIGVKFPVEGALASAAEGHTETEFDELSASENTFERKLGVPLLEIYVPIFAEGGSRQIAVAEMYIRADRLKWNLSYKTQQTWMFMGLLTIAMLLLLSSIVKRADSTIKRQQTDLEDRVESLSNLLADNRRLNLEVKKANRGAVALNDQYLRKLGADLHDGPGQLLAVTLMRIDAILPKRSNAKSLKARTVFVGALKDAMRELRNISAGLALPEIDKLRVSDALKLAVSSHEGRTGTRVETEFHNLPDFAPGDVKAALYRFVQEGLNNAFRHAGGKGQRLSVAADASAIRIRLSDSGPGFAWKDNEAGDPKLGLSGLRYRMIALGGKFDIVSKSGQGTAIMATIPVGRPGSNDE